ncbi:MAG: bifunctional [glutamine synthetase] adenylyltransferase/[glutamine synthetase]-adenylyl-L-tyrosine phosphorylase [Acidimicrobiia bacterium]
MGPPPDVVETAVRGASRSLGRLLDVDREARAVLEHLDQRAPVDDASPEALARWKQHEYLRIAARDLAGLDPLEEVGAALATMAADVFEAACRLTPHGTRLTVVGMGKLGGRELNYASDVDIVFVGDSDGLARTAQAVATIARRCFRVDLNLRPEGRNGAVVRTLESYEAYWERWAEPWEFQALVKARPIAGNRDLGAAFERSATEHLWGYRFDAESIRSLRQMKARAEAEIARRGLTDREIKLGHGGIRDVEFAVQLLQLVHGGADPELRSPSTLSALAELADAGYVARHDVEQLAGSYRFLRTVEHRMQLEDEQQVHAVPADEAGRDRLARVLGYQPSAQGAAWERFDADLIRHQTTVRAIHERLWFRPLLEDFARQGDRILTEEAAAARLAAFGFTDVGRTREAVKELTRGLTRSSRLMQQLLPLLLDWLSSAPDPDLGLLGLRHLASGPQRSMELANAFRESPRAAQRLCRLLGTSRMLGELLRRNPDFIDALASADELRPRSATELVEGSRAAVAWREDGEDQRRALKRFTDREGLRIAAHDILDLADIGTVGRALSDLAGAAVEATVTALAPPLPFAVVAMGRLGGGELSYASDLDLLFVYDGSTAADFETAERTAKALLRFLGGRVPHIYDVDADLRPEGRDGPLARSLAGYAQYLERWAQPWERLAMVRARPVAGDDELGARFLTLARRHVFDTPLGTEERREIRRIKARVESERIPAGEDPEFHLKLGRGSLADIEFCAQLLQLQYRVVTPSTGTALRRLRDEGHLDAADFTALIEAHRFLERTRNRWFLVNSSPGDALPGRPEDLYRLATSLGTTGAQLRDEYRRVTRRARRVFEQLFYGRAGTS